MSDVKVTEVRHGVRPERKECFSFGFVVGFEQMDRESEPLAEVPLKETNVATAECARWSYEGAGQKGVPAVAEPPLAGPLAGREKPKINVFVRFWPERQESETAEVALLDVALPEPVSVGITEREVEGVQLRFGETNRAADRPEDRAKER